MRKTTSKPTRTQARDQLRKQPFGVQKLPFIKHIHELRKRLFFITVFVALFGGLASSIQAQLTAALLKPAGQQQFIYTSPGGGFDFAFRICLYAGIAAAIPVIVYHLLRYMEPLVHKETMGFVTGVSIWSGILAITGLMFGYFVALPSGLHFLLQGFSSHQIKALISIQSYLSFVITYLLGSAVLFQLPLLLILINRIHRLRPVALLSYERWVVLISFVVGAIISPSPDIRNQSILSAPIILMYNISIVIIWGINRKYHRPKKVIELRRRDAEARAARLSSFEKAQASWQQNVATALQQTAPTPQLVAAAPKPTKTIAAKQKPAAARGVRSHQYAQDFKRRQYTPLTSQVIRID